MAKTITVFSDKKKRKENSWNWHVSEPSRKKKGTINVLYSAHGFNTKQIAMRRAQAHNRTLKKPLLIIEK